MNIEQLLYFYKLRVNMKSQIDKHEKKIQEAYKLISIEEESIRHLEYDTVLMEKILTDIDKSWEDKIDNYFKG